VHLPENNYSIKSLYLKATLDFKCNIIRAKCEVKLSILTMPKPRFTAIFRL